MLRLLFIIGAMCAGVTPISAAAQATDEFFTARDPAGLTAEAERYLSGEGAVQSDAQAFALFQQAASLGDARAMHQLGLMFAAGRGTPQDETAATVHYREAVAKSYAPAMTSLGIAYAEGLGVAVDPQTAYGLLSRAAAAGHRPAQDYLARHRLKP